MVSSFWIGCANILTCRNLTQAFRNSIFGERMNISEIKTILTSVNIPAHLMNPIINTVRVEDLNAFSQSEKNALQELILNMLILAQDPSSGAYLDDPSKAEALLSAIS